MDFVVIHTCDDRVLTGDENVQRHRHPGGCAHHRRGAGWRRDSPVDSSYPYRSSGCAFCVCFLRRSFACCLRVPFCVGLTPHIPHAPHHTPRTTRTTRTTHHTSHIHARQAGSVCRESDGGLLTKEVFQPIEIKGSCRKGSTQTTFTFKDIRIQGTHSICHIHM